MDFNLSTNETLPEQSTNLEIFAWSALSIAVICCNGMACAIICHERFGGDPQKRSLANRLAANVFFAFTLSTDCQVFCLILHETNAIGDYITIKILQTDRIFLLAALTFMNLHTLVIFFQVIIFKRVKEINDELCDTCLRRSVYLSSSWFSFLMPMEMRMLNGFGLKDRDICWNKLFPLIHGPG